MNVACQLRGITWAHSRGYNPLVATAQRYNELHPDVRIVWDQRSLKDFEEITTGELTKRYDLVVIDHPFIGGAVADGVLIPLDLHLPGVFLNEQSSNSVGRSYESYTWDGHQWALPIDAAAPVVAWRPDLLAASGINIPGTIGEVQTLARDGVVELPCAPVNCLLNFLSLCHSVGALPFRDRHTVVPTAVGANALQLLRSLTLNCDPGCFARNPIQSLERLAASENESVAYCIFPFGYSNYARDSYASHLLQFGDLPTYSSFGPIITVLGGTGLAISSTTRYLKLAVDYAAFVASPETQRTLYTTSGGQPGHRLAWLDDEANRITNGYFRATLQSVSRAFLRPRYKGYLAGFQKPAGRVIHRHLLGALSEKEALMELDALYLASQHLS